MAVPSVPPAPARFSTTIDWPSSLARRSNTTRGTTSAALPLIHGGQVRALLVSSNTRAADLPDVPTPGEAGLKNANSAIWFGVFMPAKTPRDIVEKFHAAGVKVLADPAMQASLKQLGVETVAMAPSEIDDLVKQETAANIALIKAAGITQ